VEPYSTVEIDYVARQVGQGQQEVEAKFVLPSAHNPLYLLLHYRLSQMILDKVFNGVLDQGRGCLLIYDETEADVSFGCVSHRRNMILKFLRAPTMRPSRPWSKSVRSWSHYMPRYALELLPSTQADVLHLKSVKIA
jgi:hypothetical protein